MSDQESSVFIGPFRDNENDCYLRQLWDRKLYRFLRSWFRTVEMDPTIGPDERGLTRIKKTDSGESWGIPPGDGGGGSSSYSSYFCVIDASTYNESGELTACKIGVTNGSAAMLDPLGSCGTVKINGERVDVDAATETVSSDGVYYVWIHSWIAAGDGEHAKIAFGAANDTYPPHNPHGGLFFASQLAGRVTVEAGAIASITQDYLRGGEHSEFLFSIDCDGGA